MTAVVKEKVFKGRKRGTLALLLSLIALGASGYLYYLANHIVHNAEARFDLIEETARANMANQNAELASLNQSLENLDHQVVSLSANSTGVINHELNELVSLANQSLIIYNDVPATLKLLKYAQNLLANDNNAIYVELKSSLTADIDALSHLDLVDPTITASKLNSILTDIDALQLVVKNNDVVTGTPMMYDQSSLPKWKIFLYNIKSTLLGLVKISKVSKNDGLRLLPQQEVIVRQNVKLDILNARMALLLHDETNWNYSLNDAASSITNYFIINPQSMNVINEIDELNKQDVATVGANINNTLKALNQLNDLNQK